MASITTGGSTSAGSYQTNSGMTTFETGTARTITLGVTSVNLALTTTCRFISIIGAGGTHCHYQIGIGAQTATSSSHYLKTGERVILTVPMEANIAAIQGTGASTTLYISELTQ
jgi:hypothetical protein